MSNQSLDALPRAKLKQAIMLDGRGYRELAEVIEVSYPRLNKFVNHDGATLPVKALRALVEELGLEEREFLQQLELELNEVVINKVTKQVRSHLRTLGREVGTLRGTSFHAFVGIRVRGDLNRVFEGAFPIEPAAETSPEDAA